MTDNEIIKALKSDLEETKLGYECFLGRGNHSNEKYEKIITFQEAVLDLINRYEAKIEALETDNAQLKADHEDLKQQFHFLDIECSRLEKSEDEDTAEIERLQKELLKSKIFKFVRNPNRIYSVMDFQDGEILRFYDYADKPSSRSKGYYRFQGKDDIRLANINEVKELSYSEIKAEVIKEFVERLKEKGHGKFNCCTKWVDFDEIDNTVREMP